MTDGGSCSSLREPLQILLSGEQQNIVPRESFHIHIHLDASQDFGRGEVGQGPEQLDRAFVLSVEILRGQREVALACQDLEVNLARAQVAGPACCSCPGRPGMPSCPRVRSIHD